MEFPRLKLGSPVAYLKNMDFDRIRQDLVAKKRFLRPGFYRTIRVGKIIVYRDDSANAFIKDLATRGASPLLVAMIKLHAKKLLGRFLGVELSGKAKSEYQGDFALVTRGGSLRIFDIEGRSVLHFVKEAAEFRQLKANYRRFSPFFDSPIVQFVDSEQLVLETLIDSKTFSHWTDEDKHAAMHTYFRSFARYLSACSDDRESDQMTFYDRWSITRELRNTLSQLDDVYQIELSERQWPYVYCHGDLWVHNILLDSSHCYFIDWEYSDRHLVFYDVIHLMMTLVRDKGDFSLMDRYFKGEFDRHIRELFALKRATYDETRRMAYITMYVAERLAKYETGFGETNLELYLDLLKRIEARHYVV